jgi:hypothetical protein
MSDFVAPRCHHIKVNGTQCGSPALRNKKFCFYHQHNRRVVVDCYYKPEEYATGEIKLPVFEDAHSIQSVIHQVVQMVLQKRLGRETANLTLYALQIASSNLKRMELEKPQPEQVVTDVEPADPIADPFSDDLPPETIQACIGSPQVPRTRASSANVWVSAPLQHSGAHYKSRSVLVSRRATATRAPLNLTPFSGQS